ncbi:unnamed protein product [Cochlearia groenlandica]
MNTMDHGSSRFSFADMREGFYTEEIFARLIHLWVTQNHIHDIDPLGIEMLFLDNKSMLSIYRVSLTPHSIRFTNLTTLVRRQHGSSTIDHQHFRIRNVGDLVQFADLNAELWYVIGFIRAIVPETLKTRVQGPLTTTAKLACAEKIHVHLRLELFPVPPLNRFSSTIVHLLQCSVAANIADVGGQVGWYYMACAHCCTRKVMLGSSLVNFQVNVEDNTENSTFTVTYNVGQQLAHRSAKDLVANIIRDSDDHQNMKYTPHALIGAIGDHYIFQIKVLPDALHIREQTIIVQRLLPSTI